MALTEYNAKRITELNAVNSINSTDNFIIARGNTESNYITYKAAFNTLSAKIYNDATSSGLNVNILPTINACMSEPSNTSKVGSAYVSKELNNKIDTISSNFNTLTAENSTFKSNVELSVNTIKNTINDAIIEQLIANRNPTTFIYKVSNNNKMTDDEKNAYLLSTQHSGTTTIHISTISKHPIIHTLTKNCIAVISLLGSCGNNACIFINHATSGKNKKYIHDNATSELSAWTCIGHFTDTADIIQLPCKKFTNLAIFKSCSRDTSTGTYKPNFSNTGFVNKQGVRIQEM